MKSILAAVVTGALSIGAVSVATAGAVLTAPVSGVQIGVNDLGHLNFGTNAGGGIAGIYKPGVGDGISPGCLCEGWGVSANGVVGRAAADVPNNGGISNLTLNSFVSTASTATSIVHISSLAGLVVTQTFTPSASSDLFQVHVTISNMTGATATNVRYSRAMDWDIPPTEFNEFVTINRGGSTALVFSNDNGFAVPNPLVNPTALLAGTTNADFVDSGPSDHGAFFTFAFGDLADGASQEFNIFYGAASSQAQAFADLAAVGAEVYSFGQSNTAGGPTLGTPATFIFAFNGVGGTVVTVPEPEMLALLGLGAFGLAFSRRRKQA